MRKNLISIYQFIKKPVVVFLICVAGLAALITNLETIADFIERKWTDIKGRNYASKEEIIQGLRDSSAFPKAANIDKVQRSVGKVNTSMQGFIDTFVEITDSIRKFNSSEFYIQIPDLPKNVYKSDSADEWRGVVIYSPNLYVMFRLSPINGKTTTDASRLELHFSNGDGITKGGSQFASINIDFNPKDDVVNLTSNNVHSALESEFGRSMNFRQFEKGTALLVKLIYEEIVYRNI